MAEEDFSAPEHRHGPGVRIHPPLIYASSILCGIGLNHPWPQPMPFGIQGTIYAGAILAAVVLLAALCIYEFHRAGTDVRPDKPDSALITSGPYCLTRNPLYIGLTLVQIAAAVVAGQCLGAGHGAGFHGGDYGLCHPPGRTLPGTGVWSGLSGLQATGAPLAVT